jgi:drug/metabolite transporter (DMT)-like permease
MKINLFIFLLIPMTLFGAIGGVYFKKYSSKKKIFLIILGLIFYGLGAIINIFLLKELPYTIVFPANALTYVWALVFAKIIFNEEIKFYRILGVCLIASGLVMLMYQ